MAQAGDPEITQALRRLPEGDREAERVVFGYLREELHPAAARLIRRQCREHTLQATALIDDVYMKLLPAADRGWNDRKHYVCVAMKALRSIFLDHEKGRLRLRRRPPGGHAPLSQAGEAGETAGTDAEDRVILDDAWGKLEEVDPESAAVLGSRVLLDLSHQEIAERFGFSLSTVERRISSGKRLLAELLRTGSTG